MLWKKCPQYQNQRGVYQKRNQYSSYIPKSRDLDPTSILLSIVMMASMPIGRKWNDISKEMSNSPVGTPRQSEQPLYLLYLLDFPTSDIK